MPNRPRQTTRSMKPRVKVWLEIDGEYVFGHRLSLILTAVDSAGSIKAAAKSLHRSYRHIWSRIKEAEEALGEPLVETRVGGSGTGRSSLTARATQLVANYNALRQKMFDLAQREFDSHFSPGSDSTEDRETRSPSA